MVKSISVLGSTGSIGTQTLDVARELKIRVSGISANRNIDLLYKQIKEFSPDIVSVRDEKAYFDLKKMVGNAFPDTAILCGDEGNSTVATYPGSEMVVAAIVGVAGLQSVVDAIDAGKDIALANKETLVAGGSFVIPRAEKRGVKIFPVDSEHSAIWQSLGQGEEVKAKPGVERLLITASGGPFLGFSAEELSKVTPKEALKHPTWDMGGKITIDSATLMNKGLEVIEAYWLFDISPEKIKVVVHPQSIIHSMVEFVDGSVIGQMGFPDMKIPIQVALTKMKRVKGVYKPFDPVAASPLTFLEPDLKAFPCLRLAYDALKTGGSLPAVMNSANEKAVELFLDGQIGFMDIPEKIEIIMDAHIKDGIINNLNTDIIRDLDVWAKNMCTRMRKSVGSA